MIDKYESLMSLLVQLKCPHVGHLAHGKNATYASEVMANDILDSIATVIRNCWFASDVTAAMLVVKNKSISLRWEMNSILMQIFAEKFLLY